MGQVKYIDYRTDYIPPGNAFNYVVHKCKSFEHEREVRAVVWNWEKPKEMVPFKDIEGRGLLVPVDISKLIEEIYVSPVSEQMFKEIVEGVARTYEVSAPVKQSEVNAPPSY